MSVDVAKLVGTVRYTGRGAPFLALARDAGLTDAQAQAIEQGDGSDGDAVAKLIEWLDKPASWFEAEEGVEQLSWLCGRREHLRMGGDLRHADGDRAALIIHGWTGWRGGSSEQLARHLLPDAVASLAVDLPGHGSSSGSAHQVLKRDFVEAAQSALDRLCERYPEREILVVGTSFGGWLAAQLCADERVRAVALRVPANYRPFRRALDPLKSFDGPIHILEAEHDQVIPPRMVQAYRDANPDQTTYQLLKDAPHSLSTAPELLNEANETLADWLRSIP